MATRDFQSHSLKEIIALLIKHHGIHEGLFDIAFDIQIGVGSFGPTAESTFPGAVVGINGVKLVKSTKVGPHTVDASVANPIPLKPKKTKK